MSKYETLLTDRARIWMLISGAADAKRLSPHLYSRMLEVRRNPHSTLLEQISVDIPRTFPRYPCDMKSGNKYVLIRLCPRNVHFAEEASDEKKQSLFNVLLAFSNSSQSIGYCQVRAIKKTYQKNCYSKMCFKCF